MGKALELTGHRYGRLLVLERAANIGRRTAWRCRCDCGAQCTVNAGSLRATRASSTKSCGCLHRDRITKHGHTSRRGYSRTYQSWMAMIQRTTNPRATGAERYSGRGITMCERWLSFSSFLSDMGERPPGRSLDRIDNNGNYEPKNCRWATPKEQANNKRRTPGLERAWHGRKRDRHGRLLPIE